MSRAGRTAARPYDDHRSHTYAGAQLRDGDVDADVVPPHPIHYGHGHDVRRVHVRAHDQCAHAHVQAATCRLTAIILQPPA